MRWAHELLLPVVQLTQSFLKNIYFSISIPPTKPIPKTWRTFSRRWTFNRRLTFNRRWTSLSRSSTERVHTRSRTSTAGLTSLVHGAVYKISLRRVVTGQKGFIQSILLVVGHTTPNLISVSPDHLGVVPGTRVKAVSVYQCRIKVEFRHLIVPTSQPFHKTSGDLSRARFPADIANVEVLAGTATIQFTSNWIVFENALVGMPLRNVGQLVIPHQPLHIGGRRLTGLVLAGYLRLQAGCVCPYFMLAVSTLPVEGWGWVYS